MSLILITACAQETKNFVKVSGKLENSKDSTVTIIDRQGIVKSMNINADGTFNDTLKVKEAAIYTIQLNQKSRAPIYLKNGYELTVNADAEDFMKTMTFSGNGADNSNFIIAQIGKSQQLGNPQRILDLEEAAFKRELAKIKKDFDSILNSYDDIDSTLYSGMIKQNEQMVTFFENAYAKNAIMGKGKPSPKFENYINIKGGKNSLEDYKGKYVYIDVWATWCGPCIQQIPYLQSLEKEYKNKNIEFISISTDEERRSGGSWEAAEQKWRKFVNEREMSGVQLWSGKDISFQQAYQITGIPRFILLDPEGKIVNANAPRPSDPQLKELLNSLL